MLSVFQLVSVKVVPAFLVAPLHEHSEAPIHMGANISLCNSLFLFVSFGLCTQLPQVSFPIPAFCHNFT